MRGQLIRYCCFYSQVKVFLLDSPSLSRWSKKDWPKGVWSRGLKASHAQASSAKMSSISSTRPSRDTRGPRWEINWLCDMRAGAGAVNVNDFTGCTCNWSYSIVGLILLIWGFKSLNHFQFLTLYIFFLFLRSRTRRKGLKKWDVSRLSMTRLEPSWLALTSTSHQFHNFFSQMPKEKW